jgi:hypothetical protein
MKIKIKKKNMECPNVKTRGKISKPVTSSSRIHQLSIYNHPTIHPFMNSQEGPWTKNE